MKILLVRHGESTGNRDHLWAGITDNELTNHGFLQAQRLGAHLSKQYRPSQIKAVYGSDLIRAKRTATAVADALQQHVQVTALLREQDLGWREGKSFQDGDKTAPGNSRAMQDNPGESKPEMDVRAQKFIHQFVQANLEQVSSSLGSKATLRTTRPAEEEGIVIVVSHGLFLIRLYSAFIVKLNIASPPPASWGNTGYLEIKIKDDGNATVTDVNSLQHLLGLKRTRAGVGSAQFDTKQRKVSDFFVKKLLKHVPEPDSDQLAVSPDDIKLPELDETKIRLATTTCDAVKASSDAEDDLEAAIKAIDAACKS